MRLRQQLSHAHLIRVRPERLLNRPQVVLRQRRVQLKQSLLHRDARRRDQRERADAIRRRLGVGVVRAVVRLVHDRPILRHEEAISRDDRLDVARGFLERVRAQAVQFSAFDDPRARAGGTGRARCRRARVRAGAA